MATTVLDSNDIPGILADAGITLDPADPAAKPAEGAAKPEAKTESKTAEVADDPDDVEGEDGLTPRQKREFTQQMQKAIGKKHRMQKEAEEFAAAQYSERQLAENRAKLLESELAELKAKTAPAPQKPAAPEKPKREDFADEYAYVDAMIQYGVDERLREKAAEDARTAAESARNAVLENAKQRIGRALELVPDYAEVTGAVDTEVPPAIAGYMQKSEMFAELGYHLAKNPDLLVSLAKLPPDEQLVKIGKIESTLTPFESKAESTTQNDSTSSKEAPNGQAKPAPSADTDTSLSKPRGKAPPVITPLEGTGSAGISKDPKDMNIREHIEDFSKKNNLNLHVRKRH